MELTLRGHSIALSHLREQVEDKTARLVKQVYQRPSSERHLQPQKQLLEASGSRYVSPIR
jgi:ribosome-associated translation inhibitor RaiA